MQSPGFPKPKGRIEAEDPRSLGARTRRRRSGAEDEFAGAAPGAWSSCAMRASARA